MRIIRAKNPIAVDYMESLLLADDDYAPGDFAKGIRGLMTSSPESIFVLQSWDGEDASMSDAVLRAFIIAFAPPRQRHVFIIQAWTHESLNDLAVKDSMFLRLMLWCEGLDRREIRAETTRSTGPFLRRWNFHERSRIIAFDIPKDLESKILDQQHSTIIGHESDNKVADVPDDALKESNNGRRLRRRSRTSLDPDSDAKTSSDVDRSAAFGKDRHGSRAIPRTVHRGSNA